MSVNNLFKQNRKKLIYQLSTKVYHNPYNLVYVSEQEMFRSMLYIVKNFTKNFRETTFQSLAPTKIRHLNISRKKSVNGLKSSVLKRK